MSDENTEETQTLDDVYAQYPIEQDAQQFNQQPVQPNTTPQTQQFVAPDPVTDPQGYQSFMANQTQAQTQQAAALNGQIQQLTDQVGRMEQQSVQQVIERDIESAVGALSEVAKGVDNEILKGALYGRAGEDPRFKNLWERRNDNPEAWNSALTALGNEVAKKIPKVDPQIAENQQALRDATESSTTQTTEGDEDARYEGMSDSEFQNEWNRLRNG